ncbi:PREDICTED: ragulator complex protein LAMTOR5 homolog [Vollenhovia emeryi]|uniref:ragulator complex protein LAMTOR5 homolog n=1 Tax=Vollenhovia emeryi TaxID=411798 RepID=UPI0005F3A3E6|nr:PREDICTED: ragulator complex protein LAMTOR5 homolog [Vollenhovia emeryi]
MTLVASENAGSFEWRARDKFDNSRFLLGPSKSVNCAGLPVSIDLGSARDSRMERNLVKTLDDTYDQEGIVGCILADHAGLCLGVKGDASSDSAGLIAAIADLVAKLEPKSASPIISLQNDDRQCIILRKESVVGAIYKDIST